MGGSPADVSEEPVTWEKRKKGWRMSCDVGEAPEGLENELVCLCEKRYVCYNTIYLHAIQGKYKVCRK